MSWMKTITRNASRPNPIRVPRPYETTPSMPDMLPSSPLEDLGKAAARLDPEKVFVVVAESILGLETHFDAVLDLLSFEGSLRRRKDVPVAAVQVLQRLPGTLDQLAPDV